MSLKTEDTTSRIVNTEGLACPLPVLKTKLALADLMSGEELLVLFSDQASMTEFFKLDFCCEVIQVDMDIFPHRIRLRKQ